MPRKVTERTDYGERLYRARTQAKLTQQKLASLAEVAQSTIAELEKTGQGSSHTPTFARLCQVRVEWLATGDGPMKGISGLTKEAAELAAQIDAITDPVKREEVLVMCAAYVNFITTRKPDPEGVDEDQPPRKTLVSRR